MGVLALTGCKEAFCSDLTENAANEMNTLLEASGHQISYQRDKKFADQLLIKKDNVGAANTILLSKRLPRMRCVSMDQVFQAQRLVASSLEARVTCSFAPKEMTTYLPVSIHGMRDARVRVELPEQSLIGRSDTNASASIIPHHEAGFSVGPAAPEIKTLIAKSVDGTGCESVSVVNLPAPTFSFCPGEWNNGLLISAAAAVAAPAPAMRTAQTRQTTIIAALVMAIDFLVHAKPALGISRKQRL